MDTRSEEEIVKPTQVSSILLEQQSIFNCPKNFTRDVSVQQIARVSIFIISTIRHELVLENQKGQKLHLMFYQFA